MRRRVRVRPLIGRPAVSVVIPCYNYGRYLRACVESVLDQPSVALEVIIVDAASTDETPAICAEIAATDDRVRVITQQVNRGHVQTFNDGLAAATGDYVVLLSADDLLAPGSLRRSAALLQAHPEVGLVYGFAPIIGDHQPRAGRRRPTGWSIWTGDEWLAQVARRGRNVMFSPEAVVRTSVLRQVGGGFEATLPHSTDLFMWLSLAAHAGVGYVNGCDQAYYRMHGDNLSTTRFGSRLADLSERRRTFELFFVRYGHRLDQDRLAAAALAALSREALSTACRWYDDGGQSAEDPAALAALAAELWPDIAQARHWRGYQARASRWRRGRRRGPTQVARSTVLRWGMRVGRRLDLRRFLHFGV